MKQLMAYFFLTFLICSAAQSQQLESKISKFILATYKLNKVYQHTVDTVIKLSDGNYFVFVRNETSGDNTVSGTYDQFKVKATGRFEILSSIKNIGKNTGGYGVCNAEFKLFYLDSLNFITVAMKTVYHMGSYAAMTIVLNASQLYFDAPISEDGTGFLEPSLNNTITVKEQNKILESLTFKCENVIMDENSDKYKIVEKSYRFTSSDFNFNLNRIMNMQLVGTKETFID